MISGGVSPVDRPRVQVIICEDPKPEVKAQCIEELGKKQTEDNNDKAALQAMNYFCGHDLDTFKKMTKPEKTQATTCNIDVMKHPEKYKQGDKNVVTVRGKSVERTFDFVKVSGLTVEDKKTTADDAFRKSAGKPTAAEEKAAAEKAAAEKAEAEKAAAAKAAEEKAAAEKARHEKLEAADKLVTEGKYDEAIAIYKELKAAAPEGDHYIHELEEKIKKAEEAKKAKAEEDAVPAPEGSLNVELNYGGNNDIFGKGVAKGKVPLTKEAGVRAGVEIGNTPALVYEGTPFALAEGESPESSTSVSGTVAGYYLLDLAGEKKTQEEKDKEAKEGAVSKALEFALGIDKYGHLKPGFGFKTTLKLKGSTKLDLKTVEKEEPEDEPAAPAGETHAEHACEEDHEDEEETEKPTKVAPFWNFSAMLYGGASRTTPWSKDEKRGLFEDGFTASLMVNGEYSPLKILEVVDPKKDPRTSSEVALFLSGSYALAGSSAKAPTDMDVGAFELGLRGKHDLGIPMQLEVAGGAFYLFPEEGDAVPEVTFRGAYQAYFSRLEKYWFYADFSRVTATHDIKQRENTPNIGVSKTIEVGTTVTQAGGGLGAKIGEKLELKVGLNYLDRCGVEGDDEACDPDKLHLFVGLNL